MCSTNIFQNEFPRPGTYSPDVIGVSLNYLSRPVTAFSMIGFARARVQKVPNCARRQPDYFLGSQTALDRSFLGACGSGCDGPRGTGPAELAGKNEISGRAGFYTIRSR